jgi:hypothetical protein
VSLLVLHDSEVSIRMYGALHLGEGCQVYCLVCFCWWLCVCSGVQVCPFCWHRQCHDYAIGHFGIEYTMLTVLRYWTLGIQCQILYLVVMPEFLLVSLYIKDSVHNISILSYKSVIYYRNFVFSICKIGFFLPTQLVHVVDS